MEERLHILWATGDPITSEKMLCMYARNSMLRGWWSGVTVIIWGASAALVADSEAIQMKVKELQMAGVQLSACRACADQLGVTAKLLGLGIEVKGWGEPLTEILRAGAPLLTI